MVASSEAMTSVGGGIVFEIERLRLEKAQLKDEFNRVDRICMLASRFLRFAPESIMRVWGMLPGKLLDNGIKVVVGRGDKAKLWSNVLVGSIPLNNFFPIIFALVCNKNGSVREYGKWENENWKWDVSMRRPLFSWELEQWECFQWYGQYGNQGMVKLSKLRKQALLKRGI
ncbi:hypothetical protein Dsin_013103 [Dipteronia sinensis]|uniref:Uncharacterized protein n=1 Tax=Dipteronia sinensis TaxID=43782 RepID=A0AAE0AJB3_9ROSI|nr:hypothetical protein Dsin_013103 [Dipteronia sinensis]